MPQYKFTLQRGKVDLKDITVAAGSAEAQSDTISINMDITNMTRGEVYHMIEKFEQFILGGKWPPL